MIYATMQGKLATQHEAQTMQQNNNIKELKVPDNCHCGHMFKLGTRVVFKKFGSIQRGWNK